MSKLFPAGRIKYIVWVEEETPLPGSAFDDGVGTTVYQFSGNAGTLRYQAGRPVEQNTLTQLTPGTLYQVSARTDIYLPDSTLGLAPDFYPTVPGGSTTTTSTTTTTASPSTTSSTTTTSSTAPPSYLTVAYSNSSTVNDVSVLTDQNLEPGATNQRSRILFNGIGITYGTVNDTTLRLGGVDIASVTFPSDYIGQNFTFYFVQNGLYYTKRFASNRYIDLDSTNYSSTAVANAATVADITLLTNQSVEPSQSALRSRLQFDGLGITYGTVRDMTLRINGEDAAAITFPSDYLDSEFSFFSFLSGRTYVQRFSNSPVLNLE